MDLWAVCLFVRWRYSFNSILEVHIRRYSHMWSWSNIRQHRENLRAYKTAYKTKLLSQSKPIQDTERQIQVQLTDPKLKQLSLDIFMNGSVLRFDLLTD